jgi:acetyl esterase/lipase
MSSVWSKVVFALKTSLFAAKAAGLLAFFSLYYIPKSLRPVPEWPYRLALSTVLLRAAFRYLADTRNQLPMQLEPINEGDRFVLMEPPRTPLSGALASESIKPGPVGGVWFPERPQPEAQRVWIQFVGGAFVLGYPPNMTSKLFGNVATKHFKATHTLSAQYRLAKPGTCFPAAVQDAVTAYNYVLSLGVSPKNIFLAGDSAGANIALALVRYIESAQLPTPGKYSVVSARRNADQALHRWRLVVFSLGPCAAQCWGGLSQPSKCRLGLARTRNLGLGRQCLYPGWRDFKRS